MRTHEPNFEGATLNAYMVKSSEIQDDDIYGYKIIAVVFSFPFWAAYRGPTGWSDTRVAGEGDKLSQEIASLLFPAIAGSGRVYND